MGTTGVDDDAAAVVVKVKVLILVSNPRIIGTVVVEMDGGGLSTDTVVDSSGGSGCSFGFRLTDEKLGRMTRDETRYRPGIRLLAGERLDTELDDMGTTVSVADSRTTDRVRVRSLFKPPKGRLVTVTATFFFDCEDDSASTRLMSSSGGGGVVGSAASVVTGGKVFTASSTAEEVVSAEVLVLSEVTTADGLMRTRRPGRPDPGMRVRTTSGRELLSTGRRGFRVLIKTRVLPDDMSGVRVGT